MKYSMLFKHTRGAGVCLGKTIGFGCLYPLFFKLVCLFKIEIKINYFIKENFEGWEKEDYGETIKVIPIKIFFRHLNRKNRIKIAKDYIISERKFKNADLS